MAEAQPEMLLPAARGELPAELQALGPWSKMAMPRKSTKVECHHVAQASIELLTSDDPSTSASQSAGITGLTHCAWPPPALKKQDPRKKLHKLPEHKWRLLERTVKPPLPLAEWCPGVNGFLLLSAYQITHTVSLCPPGWSAVTQSWLTATSASQVEVILLP
ncbi:Protein GVQW1 [Plecturocebus cupreus]